MFTESAVTIETAACFWVYGGSKLSIQEYPEVTMEGRKVYELDLHGKKLTRVEGLEKVSSCLGDVSIVM